MKVKVYENGHITIGRKALPGVGEDQRRYPCPACGEESLYVWSEDHFFHTDGSENGPCWVRAGRDEPFRTEQHAITRLQPGGRLLLDDDTRWLPAPA